MSSACPERRQRRGPVLTPLGKRVEHEMPSWPQQFGTALQPACYSKLYSACSHTAAACGGETPSANRRELSHIEKIGSLETIKPPGKAKKMKTKKKNTTRVRVCARARVDVERIDLILPPNACFITKFMMMAFNSLPSFSQQCYIQL